MLSCYILKPPACIAFKSLTRKLNINVYDKQLSLHLRPKYRYYYAFITPKQQNTKGTSTIQKNKALKSKHQLQ